VKPVVYALAAVLGLLGLVMLIAAGNSNAVVRIVMGVVLLGAAGALIALLKLKPTQQTHIHQMRLDLPGNTTLEKITCRQCGAELSSQSVNVAAGAVFVNCEYCGATYQLEEAPKW
jgi:hypothetical protein